MATREAACHCGQLRLEVTGEPFAVSICNCLACQRRTGSAFGIQAGFRADQVRIEGRFNDFGESPTRQTGRSTFYTSAPADAVEHLREAIDMWDGCRDLAKEDSDFDAIRDDPGFQELTAPRP
jgi:hypothetical protein